jgi:phage tail-like protein
MPASQAPDAIVASRFSIVIDGAEVAMFTELQNMWSEVEPIEFYHNAGNGGSPTLAKLPGKTKSPTISLKRGSDSNMYMWTWHEAVKKGQYGDSLRSGSINMYDTTGTKKVAMYEFTDAWCSKMSLSGLKAGASEVLIEEVTITCTSLDRASV